MVDDESEVVLYPAFLDPTTAGDLAGSLTEQLDWRQGRGEQRLAGARARSSRSRLLVQAHLLADDTDLARCEIASFP